MKPWIKSRRFWGGFFIGYILCGLTALIIVLFTIPESQANGGIKIPWEPQKTYAMNCYAPSNQQYTLPYIEGWKDGVALPGVVLPGVGKSQYAPFFIPYESFGSWGHPDNRLLPKECDNNYVNEPSIQFLIIIALLVMIIIMRRKR